MEAYGWSTDGGVGAVRRLLLEPFEGQIPCIASEAFERKLKLILGLLFSSSSS